MSSEEPVDASAAAPRASDEVSDSDTGLEDKTPIAGVNDAEEATGAAPEDADLAGEDADDDDLFGDGGEDGDEEEPAPASVPSLKHCNPCRTDHATEEPALSTTRSWTPETTKVEPIESVMRIAPARSKRSSSRSISWTRTLPDMPSQNPVMASYTFSKFLVS
jgi:hypothetical protein